MGWSEKMHNVRSLKNGRHLVLNNMCDEADESVGYFEPLHNLASLVVTFSAELALPRRKRLL